MVDKINILYKYRPIDEYTIKLLENNELHFSFPREFNDPFDCDASIEYGGTKEEIDDWIKQNEGIKKDDNMNPLTTKYNYDLTIINSLLKQFIDYSAKNTIQIYCLAGQRDSILMWSHYSDKHKGICLGFNAYQQNNGLSLQLDENVNRFEPKNRALIFKVNYQDSIPEAFNPIKNSSFSLLEFFKSKSKIWEYENEYRAHILYEFIEKREFKFNKSILSEVIFGIQSPEEDKRKIIDIVEKHYIQQGFCVKIFQAEKVEGKIEIGFKQIN